MATDSYEIVDLGQWPRRELFEHFSRLRMPHFSVAANVDVSRLLAYKRARGLSFYLSLVYLVTETLNETDNFRLRMLDGQVVMYDRIHTNFTHKTAGEELFRYHTAPLEGTLPAYVAATTEAMRKQTGLFGGLGDIPNTAYCSCTPHLETTAIVNHVVDNPDDAIPRINWGKYALHDGRWILNMTLCVNHRFIDGSHIERFFQRLQEKINQLEI